MKTIDELKVNYYPLKSLTQTERVLHALLYAEALTPITAWETLGVYRLAAVIHVLRKEHGLDIRLGKLRVMNVFRGWGNMANYRLYCDGVEHDRLTLSENSIGGKTPS